MFMQKGFEKTTLMDISKLSGVSKRVIIYEMNSKEEILSHTDEDVKILGGVLLYRKKLTATNSDFIGLYFAIPTPCSFWLNVLS